MKKPINKANNSLLEFKNIIETVREYQQDHSISHTIEKVLENSGYSATIADDSLESSVRREYLEEFLSVANGFEETHEEISLESFLEEISLVADMKQYDQLENKLTLMTLHSAKGLEYDYVFLVGMEEGILPHKNSIDDIKELEEERRLCYVGITRAREKLYITNSNSRMFLGSRNINIASRFIKEIGLNLLEKDGEVMEVVSTYSDNNYSSETKTDFAVGDKVKHIDHCCCGYHMGTD